MRYYEPLSYVVPPEEDGFTLKTILRDRMGLSRKLLSRLKLTNEGITVNGQRRYTNATVRAGDRVEVRMEEEQSDDILPQNIPIDLLHEDDHLLVLNKPAGIIVHPTIGHYTNTIANAVVHHWLQAGRRHRFRPVHRLDRETSGVLVIAKNPYAHQHISEQMQSGRVEKRYLAVVRGRVREEAGTIDAPIDRDPQSPHIRIVTASGYPSVTHYETVERFGEVATLVSIRLETGRTHQIRVHMKHIGHPLLGDSLYSAEGSGAEAGCARSDAKAVAGEAAAIDRQALHAAALAFAHPADGRPVRFEAPLPADMSRMIERLRNVGNH